jgi:AcrR family transcriptional regulator
MPKKTTTRSKIEHTTAAGRDAMLSDVPDGELRKSDNTRMRILNAAAYVLSQEGYAGTKLADIAKRADLRISTLYYYFESREVLVVAVLLTGSTQVRKHTEAALAALASDTSPLERLGIAVESHLRYVLEISHYTEAAVRNVGQMPEHLRTEVEKEQARYGKIWQKLVDDAVTGKDYPSANERRALRLLILGALNWTVEWWTPSRASVDEVVSAALTMTRRALGAR